MIGDARQSADWFDINVPPAQNVIGSWDMKIGLIKSGVTDVFVKVGSATDLHVRFRPSSTVFHF